MLDEEVLTTSQDIRTEMLAVEAEKKRLMDAFNGLELTSLTKRQRRLGPSPPSSTGDASTWTLVPPDRSLSRQGYDSDVISLRSITSSGTTPGLSARHALRPQLSGSLLSSHSRPGSLHRKGSISSVSSSRTGGGRSPLSLTASPAPAAPPLPIPLSHSNGSASSLNLTRSTGHLPMSSLPEDAETKSFISSSAFGDEEDHETDEIRRRREEVKQRYDTRLEFLRAKLKGAELHEKLLKR